MEVNKINLNTSVNLEDNKNNTSKNKLIPLINIDCFNKDNINISTNRNKSINFTNLIETKFFVGDIKGNKLGYISEKDFINAIKELNETNINKDFVVISKDNKFFIYELKNNKFFNDDLDNYSELRISPEKIQIPENTKLVAISSNKRSFRFFYNDKTDKNVYEKIENPLPDESLESLSKKLNLVLNRLDKMEKTLTASKDHKGLFVSMYKVITNRALKEMQGYIKEGKNKEAEFVVKLAINFANKYFDAYDNLVNGDIEKIPEAWRYAFDSGRISKVDNYPRESLIEILALSMNAHILHDLPFTLKEIGFNPKDKVINDTFDHFNKALYEEKDNIIKAITKNYGNKLENFDEFTSKIDFVLSGFSIKKREPITQNLFTSMRTIAKKSSQNMDDKEIKDFSTKTANSIISLIPGGNYETISIKDNLSIFFNKNVQNLFKKR
ncbi:MAG: hypothetical protein KatS3mg068_1198 [Candidatus Sericytochromatia bacterium]|nr:MAG: hypothetical protein KatS3mg068_1198 [Candidatus Sericytochromatia bacterium]